MVQAVETPAAVLPSVTNLSTQPTVAPALKGVQDAKTTRRDEMQKTIDTTLERLVQQINAGYTDEYRKVLLFYKKFWKYSQPNQFLIAWQKPNASVVAGFRKWEALGRHVAKGSKAAFIWVPMFRKELNPETGKKEEVLIGFRDGAVFGDCDLVDIETNPLPSLWKPLPDYKSELLDTLIAKIRASGVEVVRARMPVNQHGYATNNGKLIALNDRLDSQNTLATLMHEYTHACLHFDDTNPVAEHQVEADAEAVSFVMSTILEMEYHSSSDYLLSHKVSAESLKESFNRVQRIVKQIVGMLEIEAGEV